MSRHIVQTLSRVLDRRADRRGFLSRSALGATAFAVAPATFALRPTTAHAAICSCQGLDCNCDGSERSTPDLGPVGSARRRRAIRGCSCT